MFNNNNNNKYNFCFVIKIVKEDNESVDGLSLVYDTFCNAWLPDSTVPFPQFLPFLLQLVLFPFPLFAFQLKRMNIVSAHLKLILP